jgi:putative tricarboxylic transport membrane protein
VTLLAPANPGGGWDQTARQIQQVWTEAGILGVPVEVVNRGGAGGTIGLADFVTRHRGNPRTLMVFGQVMLGAIRTNRTPLSIDDTVPLARLLDEYEVIAVPAGSPHETLADLLRDFRADPERVSWAGGSAGGIDHMLAGLLALAAGVDPTRVNYVAHSGGGEAAVSVMGGHVTAGISGFGEWKAHAESGRMRVLAVSSPERIAESDVPTIRESGLDVVIVNWRGILAPPGTDDETRAWLIEALARLRASEAWQDILRRNDWEDSFLAGDDFERFLEQETAVADEILRSIGLAGPAG